MNLCSPYALCLAVLSLSVCMALPGLALAGDLELKPGRTVIVVPQNPQGSENIAAGLLSNYLGRVTGNDKGFPVVRENQWTAKPEEVVISVGATSWGHDPRLAHLDDDGFVITRREGRVIVAGKTPEANHFAVVSFLDRYAGVRFYMPGDLWTSLPSQPSIRVQGPDIVQSPFVVSAFLSGITMDNHDEYAWLRRNGGIRRKGGTHQHNIFDMFPPEKFAQRYPDIYPIKDGKRVIPASGRDQSWQINFTAPNLMAAAQESINEFFGKNPEHRYVAISLNDGGRWDESPETRAEIQKYLADHPGSIEAHATSHQYWTFMNRVAQWMLEAHPGKRLVGLAYGPTRFPPSFKLASNLTPFTNLHVGQLPVDHLLEAPAGQTPVVDQWLAVASHLGNHDWYQGSGYLLPRIYSGYWVQFLRALQKRVPQTYQHVECYPNWGLDGPKLYILTRLLWDPKLDANALLQQYCQDMFGPASSPMCDYFTQLEALWVQLNITDGPERKLYRWPQQFQTTAVSREMLARCRALLDEAGRRLASAEQRQRWALLEETFAFSESLFAIAASPSADEARRDRALALAAKIKDNRMSVRAAAEPGAAAKAVHWEKVKSGTAPFNVPVITKPALGLPEDWAGVPLTPGFAIEGGDSDPQKTRLQIGHDTQAIYLRVTCPKADMSKLVESHNRDWRSDNVEVFFDIDLDGQQMDRQLWVKTTGEVVDWAGENIGRGDLLGGKVQKLADRYVVEIVVPFAYLDKSFSPNMKLGIRVVRNEFTPVRGRNELTYNAVWSRRLTLTAR